MSSIGWVSEILVDEIGVATRLLCFVEGFDEGVIEAEYVVVVVNEFVDKC